MIHDQALVDRLGAIDPERFEGAVFRATRLDADPTAPSISGGRWGLPPNGNPGLLILYTSLERDGAVAEVAHFLASLNPLPGPRPIKVTRLAVSAARVVRLDLEMLGRLGVDRARYGERDYAATQKIGNALAFLGIDGLIAPSARWPCENLMLFTENHTLNETLEPLDQEEVEWRTWASEHGLLG